MAPAVYQAQLLSAFIESVSSAVPARLAPTMQCHSIWLSEIAKLRTISPTLIWAIRAMSLSHLGRQIQDRNLIQDSRTMYGKALLKLNKALQDPIEGVSSDTLSATVLLSFYEMLNCTERFSWVRHAGGAAKLMRLRGPDRHRTGFGLAVFMSVRYSIILQSIQSREECFLNEPSWRALSREIKLIAPIKTRSSALDDAKEDFFQEFVASPGFLARAINYMEVNGTDREILQDLVREGHIHRSSYKTIWARTIDALCEAGQEPILTPSPSHDKLFPDQYQYPSDLIANFYCGYRTTMTAVNTALIGLEAKLSALQSVSSSREGFEPRDMKNEREVVETANATVNRAGRPQKAYLIRALHSLEWPESPWSEMVTPPRFSSPEPTASPRDYPTMSAKDTISRRNLYLAENVHLARETCRSVEHVAMTAFLGPLFTVFALRVALRVLRSEDEKAWMLEKLDGLAKVLGVAQVEADVYRQEQETPQDQLGSPPELLA
ncbi:hypothetical protein MMC21_002423 [Puttea exsequens]|nr:hypothetical protein [Puttea exsequens]